MIVEQREEARTVPPKVLLVEDNAAVARMLRLCLGASGFDLVEASLGGEALEILERDAPDAVVLDLNLPDRLGGQVLDRLRDAAGSGGPTWIVVSALNREEAADRYGPLGSHFLSKPFDPWELIRMLKELVEARGERACASPADTPERRTR